jgi:hypothetical protein
MHFAVDVMLRGVGGGRYAAAEPQHQGEDLRPREVLQRQPHSRSNGYNKSSYVYLRPVIVRVI